MTSSSTSRNDSTATRRSAVTLGLAVAIAGALLATVYTVTSPTIRASREALQRRAIAELLPPSEQYDNEPLHDVIEFAERQDHNGNTEYRRISPIALGQLYRARLDAVPAAAVLSLRTDRGYSGDITLLVGIETDGTLRGVRVTSHRETPGLGDAIEARRNDWIRQFDALDVSELQREDWRITRDGGRFDGLTGASVTARAVVDAIGDALEWYQPRQHELFALPIGTVPAPVTPGTVQ